MIFLPNKYERFCAAVRNRIQNRNISLPISPKNIEILRKIYYAEAILKEKENVPIEINEYAKNILGAVQILKIEKEKPFTFKIVTKDRYLLDKKTLEILLILLSRNSTHISIYEYKSNLVIKADTLPDLKFQKLLLKMKANSVYEHKEGYIFALFSAEKTTKKSIKNAEEKEILCNPFSSANIFI